MEKNEMNNHGAAVQAEMDNTSRAEKWILEHKNTLCWTVGLIAIVIIGYVALDNLVWKPKAAEASDELAKAALYFQMGQYDAALNGDNADCMGFEAIANDYSFYQPGKMAALYAGLCYFEKGEYEQAADYMAKYDAKDAVIAPAAKMHLADAYIELGRLDDAAEALNDAVKAESTVISPMAAKKLGILYLKQDKKEAAHDAFMLIRTNYPASAEAQDIDLLISYTE